MSETKTYLGDSVYAEYRNGHLVLTTDDEFGATTNTIFLELEVLESLNAFAEQVAQGLVILRCVGSRLQ